MVVLVVAVLVGKKSLLNLTERGNLELIQDGGVAGIGMDSMESFVVPVVVTWNCCCCYTSVIYTISWF